MRNKKIPKIESKDIGIVGLFGFFGINLLRTYVLTGTPGKVFILSQTCKFV